MVFASIAVSAGLLEAAWTGAGRGAPTNTWLGVGALLVIFAVVTFPRLWWVPGLAILEELVHLVAGYALLPNWNHVLGHWSTAYLGVNLYPWITFPLITLVGEALQRRRHRSRRRVAWKIRSPYDEFSSREDNTYPSSDR